MRAVAAWAMGKSLFEMGVLTAVIAWIALVWNMIYNAGFDRLKTVGLTRNLRCASFMPSASSWA